MPHIADRLADTEGSVRDQSEYVQITWNTQAKTLLRKGEEWLVKE